MIVKSRRIALRGIYCFPISLENRTLDSFVHTCLLEPIIMVKIDHEVAICEFK